MVAFPSIPWLRRRDPAPWCRTALAQDPSLQGAVDAVAQQLNGCGPADLAGGEGVHGGVVDVADIGAAALGGDLHIARGGHLGRVIDDMGNSVSPNTGGLASGYTTNRSVVQ